jgi:septal ring factor EnvC (AmiA/AmiB activator)
VWKKSKKLLLLSVLSLLYLFVPSISYSYADVILTDQEAQELMNEIQESKKDLTELQTQLKDVKSDYEEQKKSYEEQLTEAKKNEERLRIATSAAGGSAVALLIITVLLIIF